MKNLYILILLAFFPLAGFGQTVNFSTQRGFYQTPFSLTLSTSISGGSIRYTTDGSTPSASNGATYSGSIPINSTSVIRAIGFNGSVVSPVVTHSYLFLDNILQQPANIAGWPNHSYALGSGTATAVHDYEMDPDVVNSPAYAVPIKEGLRSIPTMSLVLNRDTFMNLYEGESTFTASVEILYPDNTSEQFNTGLESHSHDRLKRSLKLNIKSLVTTNLFRKGPATSTGATNTFTNTKIVLRAGNNRSWARNWNADRTCYTRDEWYRSSYQAVSASGGRGTFVHLYVDGLYWGLYNPVERTDAGMLSNYFGGSFDDWMALDPDGIRSGDPARFNYLTTTLASRDMSIAANYTEAKEYLDIEKFCDYLILTWMMGMTDWPGNNFQGGNRNNPPAPYFYNAWDGEWSFDTSNGSNNGAWVHPNFLNNQSSNVVIPKLWHSLRRNADFMQVFADRVYRNCFNNGALTDQASRQRWAVINNYIRTAIIAESARWGDALQDGVTRTRDGHWAPEIDRVDGLMNGNVNRFISALLAQGYFTLLSAPTFSSEGGPVAPGFQVTITNPNSAGTIYYTLDGNDPRLPGGGISPNALVYSGPVTINNQATLKSRIFNSNSWSPLHESAFTIQNLVTGLFINEFGASNTKLADEFGEVDGDWIEIYNSNNTPVDIGGLYLTDNLANLTLVQIPSTNPAVTTIPAKGFLVIWADGTPAQGPLHILPKLSKSGEQIGLSQVIGTSTVNIDNITFGAQADDVSEGRFPDGSATMKQFVVPTPGTPNIVTFKSGLFINEVLASNQNSITDEAGEHDGWLEIYNNNSQPVDIGGLYLTDDLNIRNKWRIPTSQPALTTIPARGFITLWADNQPAQGNLHTNFTLNTSGGVIVLSDIVGTDVSLVDSLAYQAQTADISTGRYPDASAQFKKFDPPSPKAPNVLPEVSNLFINEFMASNSKLADEFGVFEDWIEIYNANSFPVDIGGLFISDNLSNLTKYQIPTTRPDQTTIAAGGFLQLWADEQPFQGVLHVGVKLSTGGEQIGLSQQNAGVTRVIDSLSFGMQTTDVSRGRQPNGSANFTNFTTPTPGASNNLPAGLQVVSFTLVNANTETDIQTISPGMVINLANLPTSNLNIRANTSPSPTGRVVFALTGAQTRNSTETGAPYALFGDISGNYNAWVPPLGSYTLTGTPYPTTTGGTAGTPLTLSFSVIRQGVNQLPTANAGPDKTIVQPASSTTLNGSGSDAEDGTNVTYAWSQVSGPNTAVFSSTSAQVPAVSGLTVGTYIFSLIVRDQNQASSAADQVSVIVNPNTGPTLVSFTLINANTEQPIQTITPGMVINLASLPTSNLNIRANTNPVTTGRVVFALTGAQTRNQNETGAPYALFGDNSGNYNAWVPPLGNYTLTGTPYPTTTGGTAGTPLTLSFSVIRQGVNQLPTSNAGPDKTIVQPASSTTLNGSGSDAEDGTNVTFAWSQVSGPNTAVFSSTSAQVPTVSGLTVGTYVFSLIVRDQNQASSAADQVSVIVNPNTGPSLVSFTLINANTEQPIQTITPGMIINLANLPTSNLNIRANTNPATTGRVVLALTGAQTRNQTETGAPYALFGDNSGNYNAWVPPLGNYTLTGTPYPTATGGTAGTPLTLSFSVIRQASLQTLSSLTPLNDQINNVVPATLVVYPNPVSDGRFAVSNGHIISGEVAYTLRDQMGGKLVSGIISVTHADPILSFDLSSYMQKVGVYYLQLKGKDVSGVVKLIR